RASRTTGDAAGLGVVARVADAVFVRVRLVWVLDVRAVVLAVGESVEVAVVVLGVGRVGPEAGLVAVGDAARVGVWIERVAAPVVDLLAVRQSVVVGVGVLGIGPEFGLVRVREPVLVRVDGHDVVLGIERIAAGVDLLAVRLAAAVGVGV